MLTVQLSRYDIFIARILAAVLLSAAIISAEVGTSEASEKTVLQLAWKHQFQFAGYYAALHKGYYRQAVLDVAIVEGGQGKFAREEVLSGRAQYGVAGAELLLHRRDGNPFVVLAPVFQHSPSILLARKDSGIATIQDLVGKRVMLLPGKKDADILAAFLNEGVPLDAFHRLDQTYDLDDLIQGRTDAVSAYVTNEPWQLLQQGIEPAVISPRTSGVDFYSDCLFTTEAEIRKHPRRVQAFLEASLLGWEYAVAHPKEIIDLLITEYGVKKHPDHLDYEAQAIQKMMLPELVQIGHMNPGRWRHIAGVYRKLGLLDADFSLDGFLYDPGSQQTFPWLNRTFFAALFVIVMLAIGTGFLVVINRRLRSEVQERKQAEKALKESEERFNLAMDASKDGVYEWDLETREIYYSPGWKRMLGYEPDELPDDFSIWETLTRPEDVEKSWQIMKEVVEQKRERFEVEFEMRHKDGHWIHVLSRANIYKDANGKPVRVVGTHVDITESKNQRERLRLSESRYRKAQKLAKVGNWEYDLKTTEFWGSDEAKKIYGFDPEQDSFTTEDVESCIIERERVHQALVDLIEKGKPYNLAFDIITKNTGRIKTIVSIAEIETDGADNPVKVSGVIHDITERRQAEKALIEKEALFRGLFDHMTSGSAVYEVRNDGSKGTDYIIREFNRKSLELEGKNLDEVLGKSLFDLRPNIDDYGLIPVMKKVWETGIPEFFPARIYQDDTFSNYYENHIFKLPSGEVVTIYNDVTDQKNQEKDLRESEKKYRVLFDTVPLGITVSDQFGNIVESNAVSEKLLGTPETEPGTRTIDKPQWRIIRPDGTPMPETEYAGVRALKENRPIENVEMGIVKSDMEITWMNVSAAPLHLEKYGAVVAYVDITGRKRADAEKEKLHTQLLQAQKMESVGRLAGGVAHDFNNMLGVILGHAELALLQADETHDLHADLQEIQKAAKRSADITKQLLAFARKQTISPRTLDLNDMVESMLKMLRRLIGEDIDLVWQAAAHIWPVKMDPSQIDQILANLCINARDAISGVGKITIETGIRTFDDEYCRDHPGCIPGDFVLLAVSDNGCGMDKDTLANLFEPFFTTKEVGKGTGLGLATVYGIVKQNNGFINVYSEPGQGAIFKIYLPRVFIDEETATEVGEKKSAAGGTETILLVEDEVSVLGMTRMMLERKGYTVLSAATPAEAMGKAKNWSGAIDLLITDVVMPEMNGQDLAKKITDLYPDILCLYMSGYTAEVIAHHGVLDAGVAFIQKPFSMAAMTEKVRDVLDNASEDR